MNNNNERKLRSSSKNQRNNSINKNTINEKSKEKTSKSKESNNLTKSFYIIINIEKKPSKTKSLIKNQAQIVKETKDQKLEKRLESIHQSKKAIIERKLTLGRTNDDHERFNKPIDFKIKSILNGDRFDIEKKFKEVTSHFEIALHYTNEHFAIIKKEINKNVIYYHNNSILF
jgi:hypothetical protein